MHTNSFLARLGITHPVILAPMGGGPGTPELVAAVSNAGGLGSLGAAYLTAEQITDAVRRIRALTDRPFNVNLFAGGYETKRHVDPAPMLAHLAAIHAALGLPAPSAPAMTVDPFPAQLDAVLAGRPAVFSFTFGIPAAETMARARAAGMIVLGTATTVEEARMLGAAGVDGIVAQGAEAGAHRGTFAGRFEEAMVPTRDLVRGIVERLQVPVIASGGIMDGAELAAALALGAVAAQLGTAFLTCPESGASPAYKKAILDARGDTTVITRAFSGRPARGLENAFITGLAGKEETVLPYPIQNALTRPMRTAAGERGDARYLSLWAGTGVARARAMPAGELVRTLMAEASAALGRPAFS